VTEAQDIVGHRRIALAGLYKLVEMVRREAETHHIETVYPLGAGFGSGQQTTVAFRILFPAINVAAQAKPEFEVVFPGLVFFVMLHQHAGIIHLPLGVAVVALDGVLNRTGDQLVFLLEQVEFLLHEGVPVGQ
jgi:hypothetical protein